MMDKRITRMARAGKTRVLMFGKWWYLERTGTTYRRRHVNDPVATALRDISDDHL